MAKTHGRAKFYEPDTDNKGYRSLRSLLEMAMAVESDFRMSLARR
jgi:hypothetical protein